MSRAGSDAACLVTGRRRCVAGLPCSPGKRTPSRVAAGLRYKPCNVAGVCVEAVQATGLVLARDGRRVAHVDGEKGGRVQRECAGGALPQSGGPNCCSRRSQRSCLPHSAYGPPRLRARMTNRRRSPAPSGASSRRPRHLLGRKERFRPRDGSAPWVVGQWGGTFCLELADRNRAHTTNGRAFTDREPHVRRDRWGTERSCDLCVRIRECEVLRGRGRNRGQDENRRRHDGRHGLLVPDVPSEPQPSSSPSRSPDAAHLSFLPPAGRVGLGL